MNGSGVGCCRKETIGMTDFYRKIICVFYSGSSFVLYTAVCLENSERHSSFYA